VGHPQGTPYGREDDWTKDTRGLPKPKVFSPKHTREEEKNPWKKSPDWGGACSKNSETEGHVKGGRSSGAVVKEGTFKPLEMSGVMAFMGREKGKRVLVSVVR